MIRYLAFLLLFYFVYRIIRSLFKGIRSPSPFEQTGPESKKDKKQEKIFSDDEGEYVDFEDLDK